MTSRSYCPACATEHTPADVAGNQDPTQCRPATFDAPVPGHQVEIPAWCAKYAAFTWLDLDGTIQFDRVANRTLVDTYERRTSSLDEHRVPGPYDLEVALTIARHAAGGTDEPSGMLL